MGEACLAPLACLRVDNWRVPDAEAVLKGHVVYVLACGDGSLYTGYSNDLGRRLLAHQAGKGGRYTRAHLPVSLLGYWVVRTRRCGLRAEYAFKQLSRAQKLSFLNALHVHDVGVIAPVVV